jgi:hypothetical protein
MKYVFKTKCHAGHNVSFQMTANVGGGSGYWCTTAGCTRDLNPGCPNNLKILDGGNVVACKSSCLPYNTDEYCCRGGFNDLQVCRNSPPAVYFKSNCPGTYSYAYDDGKGTFTCQNTDYFIIFG